MVYAGDFSLSLTLNLNLTDSPQYYDLPVLESTLQCLVEISAIPGFSKASKLVDPQELCVDILASLLQVNCVGFVCYINVLHTCIYCIYIRSFNVETWLTFLTFKQFYSWLVNTKFQCFLFFQGAYGIQCRSSWNYDVIYGSWSHTVCQLVSDSSCT